MALIIIPFQCIGEEYFMRGYLMQTVGSWFKIPLIAIVVQSIFFTVLHPYNMLGVISVFVSGIIFGIITCYTKGIETSSGLHSANNLLTFLFAGLGLTDVATDITLVGCLLDMGLLVFTSILVLYVSKKWGWFKEETL